jgi:hypothetical protein
MDSICDSVKLGESILNVEPVKKVKKAKKNRCPVCNKKMGLLPYTCKCGLDFCVSHIQPELHNCKYDHKTHAKQLLTCRLIKVVNEKVEKI